MNRAWKLLYTGKTAGDNDHLIKMYIINQKPPVGSRLNDDAKYTEGSGNDHLTKNIREKYGAE